MEHPALDILRQVREDGKRYFPDLPPRTANATKMALRRKGIRYLCIKMKNTNVYSIVIL